mmetsp:Transcript_28829/g.61856  ORF Transcript_28829/g.61856 Transcript_28829/m.61856 type:complete len:164 (-) Transcript_28829:512-1003(-)
MPAIEEDTDEVEEMGLWGTASEVVPTPAGGGERGARSLSIPDCGCTGDDDEESGKPAIESFAFEATRFTPSAVLLRFGEMGNDWTVEGIAVEEVLLFSEGESLCFGVGDRGGVCSDGGKRLDDACANWSTDKRPSNSRFGGGGDNGMFWAEVPGGFGLLVRSR